MDIEAACRRDLTLIAKAFAKSNKLSLPTVSRKFYGKQSFFSAFERGVCSIALRKLGEMVNQFSEEWPSGEEWPQTELLKMPDIKGGVYAIRCSGRSGEVRIGFTKYPFEKRLFHLQHEAARNGWGDVELIGKIKATLHNERSVHRLLKPYTSKKKERSWYSESPEVSAFLSKMFARGFSFGACRELIEADEKFAP